MSPAERRLVQVRLAEDVGEADNDSSEATCVSHSRGLFAHWLTFCDDHTITFADRIFDGFKLAIRDVKVWIFMLMSCVQLLGMSFINFFPT